VNQKYWTKFEKKLFPLYQSFVSFEDEMHFSKVMIIITILALAYVFPRNNQNVHNSSGVSWKQYFPFQIMGEYCKLGHSSCFQMGFSKISLM
jgi:hypothetical protein